MMKNIENREPLLWIGFLCLISLWAIEICAQGKSASATANVTVTIVTPIGIEKKSDLRFGDIIGGKGRGAVRVEAENSILLRGAVSLARQMESRFLLPNFWLRDRPVPPTRL